jgi:AcrR family transcriptional regulator
LEASPAAKPTHAAPTRSDRRRARTRQRLTDAARALIAQKGVAALRISEITGLADVALGSFYNHFESKEELVEEVVSDAIQALSEAMVARMASIEDPAEAVSFATRHFVLLATDNPELASLLVNLDQADAQFERAVLPYALQALDRGIAAGRFNVADPRIALTGVVGGTLAVMRAILDGRSRGDADVLHAEAVLRAFGLALSDAHDIARRPLPALESAAPSLRAAGSTAA